MSFAAAVPVPARLIVIDGGFVYYSVTLSYNLFFEDESDTSTLAVNTFQEPAVERLTSALKLPGNFDDLQPFIAFHLQHRYVSSP